MTVLDSSSVVDYLIDGDGFVAVEEILLSEAEVAAPEVLVFEVLAVLRRESGRWLTADRADRAAMRLGELPLELSPSMPLRARAWALRHNFRIGDAMFIALAERLGEPLITKDRPLAAAARRHTSVEVRLLTGSAN